VTKTNLSQRLHSYKERIKAANQEWEKSRFKTPPTLLPGEYSVVTEKGALKLIIRQNAIEIRADDKTLTLEQLSNLVIISKQADCERAMNHEP
jgi:hypothetical protein